MGYRYADLLNETDNGRTRSRWLGSHTSIEKVLDGKRKPTFMMRYYNSDIMTWTPDGRIRIGWSYKGPGTKLRINRALPRGQFIVIRGEWIYEANNQRFVAKPGMTITPEGKVDGIGSYARFKVAGAKSYAAWWALVGPEIKARRRVQARLRYWQRMAERTRQATGATGNEAPKHPRLTVPVIMAEANTTIRMAKARAYGITKFLQDAGATVVDAEADYELLRFVITPDEPNTPEWMRGRGNVQALKMTCPSTGTLYIETVPPDVTTVRTALDWRFQTDNYLGRIGQAT